MTTLLRLTIVLGVLCIATAALLIRGEVNQLKRRSREASEEVLVDFVVTVRAMLGEKILRDGMLDGSLLEEMIAAHREKISAVIYDLEKTSVDTSILIYDRQGILVFDSGGKHPVGVSYQEWRDVHYALLGRYGARTTTNPGEPCGTMYVSVPLYHRGEVSGVISAAKPTCTSNRLVADARRQVVLLGTVIFLAAACLGFIALLVLTEPLRKLSRYVRSVRDGNPIGLPTMPPGELRELLRAIEEMRRAIDGTQVTTRYIRAISHEIKSPVTAIRGALEIVQVTDDAAIREKFFANIEQDTGRIIGLVDNLMTLNSLGTYVGGSEDEPFRLSSVIEDVLDRVRSEATVRNISVEVYADGAEDSVVGSQFLARESITNVVRNAISFSPEGGLVEIKVRHRDSKDREAESRHHAHRWVQIEIRDHGPGAPEWALPRIFDQFFSLPRPITGLRSTGLGLAITREAMTIMGGSIRAKNHPEGGFFVSLLFMSDSSDCKRERC
jgi:two-component system sensor histidine kinase CreC